MKKEAVRLLRVSSRPLQKYLAQSLGEELLRLRLTCHRKEDVPSFQTLSTTWR
jgi:hypothetical protein